MDSHALCSTADVRKACEAYITQRRNRIDLERTAYIEEKMKSTTYFFGLITFEGYSYCKALDLWNNGEPDSFLSPKDKSEMNCSLEYESVTNLYNLALNTKSEEIKLAASMSFIFKFL